MPVPATMIVRGPLLLLSRANELGLERTSLLEASGLGESDLVDPDGRVPTRKWLDMCAYFFGQLPRDAGLEVGATLELRELGVVGYLMMHCATLGQALESLARFGPIIEESDSISMRRAGRHLAFGWHPHPRQLGDLCQLADFDVSALLEVLGTLAGRAVWPIEVKLPYAVRPDDEKPWKRRFRCDVTFGAPKTELVLERRILDLPVVGSDHELGGFLEKYAEQTLAELGHGESVTERVRRRLWVGMKLGVVEIEAVAADLAMSPRTLQRRLADEGTSFTDVRDQLRHDLALRLLPDKQLAIYEIAYLLGYSEPSTFHRAFKRWEGLSPRGFRERKSA